MEGLRFLTPMEYLLPSSNLHLSLDTSKHVVSYLGYRLLEPKTMYEHSAKCPNVVVFQECCAVTC